MYMLLNPQRIIQVKSLAEIFWSLYVLNTC